MGMADWCHLLQQRRHGINADEPDMSFRDVKTVVNISSGKVSIVRDMMSMTKRYVVIEVCGVYLCRHIY
jgi:hypothetical protein